MLLPEIPVIELQNAGIWKSPDGVFASRPRFVMRCELECYLSSGGETRIDGEGCRIIADSISFSRPGQIRNSVFPFRTRFVYFDIPEPSEEFMRILDAVPTFSPPDPEAARCFDRLLEAYDRGGLEALSLLLWLIGHLAEQSASEPRQASRPISGQAEIFRAIKYMKNNLDKRLTVADMAAQAGYSLPHFNARFRQLTDSTPYEYFMSLKIGEAKRMLLSGNYGIAEIAHRLAFSGSSHFGSIFRRFVGEAPSEFARRIGHTGYDI